MIGNLSDREFVIVEKIKKRVFITIQKPILCYNITS